MPGGMACPHPFYSVSFPVGPHLTGGWWTGLLPFMEEAFCSHPLPLQGDPRKVEGLVAQWEDLPDRTEDLGRRQCQVQAGDPHRKGHLPRTWAWPWPGRLGRQGQLFSWDGQGACLPHLWPDMRGGRELPHPQTTALGRQVNWNPFRPTPGWTVVDIAHPFPARMGGQLPGSCSCLGRYASQAGDIPDRHACPDTSMPQLPARRPLGVGQAGTSLWRWWWWRQVSYPITQEDRQGHGHYPTYLGIVLPEYYYLPLPTGLLCL